MAIDKTLGNFSLQESTAALSGEKQAGSLQGMLDTFTAPAETWTKYGGILRLGRGDYYGNLVIDNPSVTIEGEGYGTVIHGSITCTTDSMILRNLRVFAKDAPYGVKLYRPLTLPGVGNARSELDHVWIGATAEGTGDGPEVGLWLDGAIVTNCYKCVFAFNTKSGLFVDTTDPAGLASTNVNTFDSCSFNGNGRYGAELITGPGGVAGMMLHRFLGGNIESNTLGDVLADSNTGLEFNGVDFEHGAHNISQMIDLSSCTPAIIQNCNFVVGSGATVSRAFLISGSGAAVVRNNRFGGFAVGAVGVFSDTCANCREYENFFSDGADRFIINRGRV